MSKRIRIRKKDVLTGKDVKAISKRGLKIKVGKILCIILQEGKGSTWYLLDENQARFSVNGNTYFNVSDGVYLKGSARFIIYIEGVSLPIHHGYIKREKIKKKVKDFDTGVTKTYEFNKIKNLSFDSTMIDILLNRHLSDVFTRQYLDVPNIVLIILLGVNLLISLVSLGANFL